MKNELSNKTIYAHNSEHNKLNLILIKPTLISLILTSNFMTTTYFISYLP